MELTSTGLIQRKTQEAVKDEDHFTPPFPEDETLIAYIIFAVGTLAIVCTVPCLCCVYCRNRRHKNQIKVRRLNLDDNRIHAEDGRDPAAQRRRDGPQDRPSIQRDHDVAIQEQIRINQLIAACILEESNHDAVPDG